MLNRGRVAPNHAYHCGKKWNQFISKWRFLGDGLSGLSFCSRQKARCDLLDLPVLYYCYDWSYEFIDLCHRKKLLTCHSGHRPESFVARTSDFCHWRTRHLWPDLPIFATDALIHFSQHLLQWYLISSPTLFTHQSTQSMNSRHTSIYSMCDLIFDHDPAHCYIQHSVHRSSYNFSVPSHVWTH